MGESTEQDGQLSCQRPSGGRGHVLRGSVTLPRGGGGKAVNDCSDVEHGEHSVGAVEDGCEGGV